MRPLPSTDDYRALFDDEDRAWFENHDARSQDRLMEEFPMAWQMWSEQAAWLTILKAFADNPDLEELVFDVDEDGPFRYVLIQTRREGQDELNELGEDPEGLDEHLQNYVNDMGRNQFIQFHRRLAQANVVLGGLDEAGAVALSGHWVAKKKEMYLDRALDKSTPPAKPTPRPRV